MGHWETTPIALNSWGETGCPGAAVGCWWGVGDAALGDGAKSSCWDKAAWGAESIPPPTPQVLRGASKELHLVEDSSETVLGSGPWHGGEGCPKGPCPKGWPQLLLRAAPGDPAAGPGPPSPRACSVPLLLPQPLVPLCTPLSIRYHGPVAVPPSAVGCEEKGFLLHPIPPHSWDPPPIHGEAGWAQSTHPGSC